MDKKLKKLIKKKSKKEFPTDRNDFGHYHGTEIAKLFEQPAFIEGANWAIKESKLVNHIDYGTELLDWILTCPLDCSKTNKEVVEIFDKQRNK